MLAAVQPTGQEINADAGREKHERGADERQELDAVHGCSLFKRSLADRESSGRERRIAITEHRSPDRGDDPDRDGG